MIRVESFPNLNYILLVLMLILISGCANDYDYASDINLRVDIVYSHTVLMKDFSYEESKGLLNYEHLLDPENMSTEDKVVALEKVFAKSIQGNLDKRISFLEQEMVLVMDELYSS